MPISRFLFHGPYRSKPQEVSTVCSGQPDLPVQLSPLWPGSSTKTFKPVAATLSLMGVCLVCYVDDILLLAQTVAEEQVKGLQYLLECLGFIVHPDKSIMTPGQVMEFLGMIVDSTKMELRLPA